ncbi:MAG: nicotinate-nucleotide adenylyltransferase [Pseudomonadota bacterium]|nr:nicotinate-nucleotide adenylyltransferase [Pseudomonadota bacterium]
MSKLIGVLGGTFDPVHYGHLRPALEVMQQAGLDEVRFLPNRQPPHRTRPWLDADTRKKLIQLAIADEPGFVLDERELRRDGPSFMVDTLADLRCDFPDAALCLLLGSDAFAGFTQWKEWQAILGLCHIIVMTRPGAELTSLPAQPAAVAACISHDAHSLRNGLHGVILLQSVTQLDISASRIRECMQQGLSTRYLLPDSIIDFLGQHREGEACNLKN